MDEDIFCETENENCKIVFEAVLVAGTNEFTLVNVRKDEIEDKIHVLEKSGDMNFAGRDYHISLNPIEGEIKYEFNDGEFIQYSFHTSQNSPSSRQSMAWNKYGHKNVKTERVVPGIYIMSNNGVLEKVKQTFSEMKVSEGLLYIKVLIISSIGRV